MLIGLLEDDVAIQEMLLLVLKDEGYEVSVYPTAEACLGALITTEQLPSPIDLLIIDWRLQGSASGTEVIRQIREQSRLSALPIILTTAATFSDTETLQNLHVSFLEKPFEVDQMVHLIHDLLQSRPHLDPDPAP
ncbi:MAG TPA: response regulator [Ktedonobacteraceae bacterium]|nr:response regulator [Ktedonobacteraceae bacterium]